MITDGETPLCACPRLMGTNRYITPSGSVHDPESVRDPESKSTWREMETEKETVQSPRFSEH